ncbi:hypothetical protein MNB_SUP05-12-498 [hydrothermal vent metagenome]|uniref:Uncharacterized protein n=1 Tax=hydrothermal vent metagenome TaxID=652676 RepID=A0A1W1DGE1_9ZZZZ
MPIFNNDPKLFELTCPIRDQRFKYDGYPPMLPSTWLTKSFCTA